MDFDKRPSPYLCGQMLEALVASGTNPEDKALVPLVDYLVDYLERAEVTIANFIHMCAAIRGVALASPPGTFETGAMGMVLAKMFHRTRLRPDGSWYRNITMTGWALVSLRSLGRIRKIDAFPHEIYPLLASVRQIVERQLSEQAAIRRRLIVHVAGAASCAVVATALLLANIAQGFTLFGRENALYFVAGNLVMVSAFFANKVRRV
ncbi:MAG: hypothetical protein Q8K82_11615 [Gemmatimonadaceae bacterium]|nr:hypothetical protein [Gemmatimonadaceae bacterium]